MSAHIFAGIPCEHVILSVWDYLDDEIDAGRRDAIRRHLELCDHCRAQYTFEKAFLGSVRRLVDGDTPTATLRDRIEQTLTEHGYQRRPLDSR